MNGRRVIILLVLLIVLILGVIYFIPRNYSFFAHLVNKNSLELNIPEGIDHEKLRLSLSISATDYQNVLIFDGHSEHRIPKGYGENDWILSYGEQSIVSFRHFKTNNWHDHHYSFNFYQDAGTIKCDVKIEGPDKMKATLNLMP